MAAGPPSPLVPPAVGSAAGEGVDDVVPVDAADPLVQVVSDVEVSPAVESDTHRAPELGLRPEAAVSGEAFEPVAGDYAQVPLGADTHDEGVDAVGCVEVARAVEDEFLSVD